MKHVMRQLLLFFVLFQTTAGFAQFRKYSNEFLNIGTGARALAMGNAQIASVEDGTAGYWNPAGLVNVKNAPQVNLMHAEYFAGIGKYDYGNLAIPLNDGKRTLGISVLRFAVDDIPNTVFLVQPDGTLNFDNITTFSSADYAFLFSLAQEVELKNESKFNFGVNAKIIHRKAGDFATAWGFGFDAGVQYQSGNLKLGAVARDVTTTFNAWSYNIGEQMREVFYVTNNEVPVKSTELTAPKLILGGAYNFNISKSFNLLAEANLDVTFDGKRGTIVSFNPVSIDPKVGLEASINNVFFVRAGINNFQKTLDDADTTNTKKVWIYQPSLGAGFKVSNVQIDYAYTNLANQSNPLYTHVFSLKLDLKKKSGKK
ncbi:PorV/PorQ family protein [Pinibacter soli]|uniref:PorV/PorQ family protein n=1 Tax=Pinibacter soli TaxID=3044211 RepID=A0ABT6RBJ1_9BACT|nr:PorV/PorQ family protein [Pinibacter soli]MDI3319909.1 PorV/PorQ family protein [Pinibacter soli]